MAKNIERDNTGIVEEGQSYSDIVQEPIEAHSGAEEPIEESRENIDAQEGFKGTVIEIDSIDDEDRIDKQAQRMKKGVRSAKVHNPKATKSKRMPRGRRPSHQGISGEIADSDERVKTQREQMDSSDLPQLSDEDIQVGVDAARRILGNLEKPSKHDS